MWKKALIFLVVLTGLTGPAAASVTGGVEILLDRRADEVSVYFAMPATDLTTVFGQGADPLLGTDGTVDIDRLYDGTYLVADDIFAGARLSIGGETMTVEALSMMLHDPAFLPGFADPYDAQVAIAVCTSPETVRGMGLPELRAYLGYHVWKVDGHEAIEITFPEVGRAPVTFTVRDFVDFREVSTQTVTISDGGVLRIDAAERSDFGTVRTAAALGALATALAFAAFLISRRARSPRAAT